MKTLIVVLAVSGATFPEMDIDTFCADGAAAQIEEPARQLEAAVLCQNVMRMSRELASRAWFAADDERRRLCLKDAADNYVRLHQCLAQSRKGDRVR